MPRPTFIALVGAFLVFMGIGFLPVPLAMWMGCLALLIYTWLLPYPIWGRFSWKTIGLGILSWIVAFPLSAGVGEVIVRFFGPFDQDQIAIQEVKNAHGFSAVFWVVSTVLVAPVVEELLFRGFLQSWLRRYFAPIWAILITATVFAVAHFSFAQGLFNAQLLPMLFVLGAILGFLYTWQKNLYAPIALHMAFNSVTTLVLLTEKI